MALEIIREQLTPPGEITVVDRYEEISMQVAISFAEIAASDEANKRDDVRHVARSREMAGKTRFVLVGHPCHDPKYSETSSIAEYSVRCTDD
jgi:hypothetical protein